MTTEERLGKVEKELAKSKRRSRVMLSMAVLTVAGVFLLCFNCDEIREARSGGKAIRAQEFDVVDQNGKTRVILGTDDSGSPGLVLYNKNGKPGVELTLGADELPALGLYDQNDKNRAALYLDKSGPTLTLSDRNETTRAGLAVCDSGSGISALMLCNQNGVSCAALGVSGDSGPELALRDQNGMLRGELHVPASGPASALRDQNGDVIWHTP